MAFFHCERQHPFITSIIDQHGVDYDNVGSALSLEFL